MNDPTPSWPAPPHRRTLRSAWIVPLVVTALVGLVATLATLLRRPLDASAAA
jgi:hypothetical protein